MLYCQYQYSTWFWNSSILGFTRTLPQSVDDECDDSQDPTLHRRQNQSIGTVQAVVVTLDDGVLMLHAMLKGLELNCVKCGTCIHKGVSLCDNADATRDHWFKIIETTNRVEPWATTFTSTTGTITKIISITLS